MAKKPKGKAKQGKKGKKKQGKKGKKKKGKKKKKQERTRKANEPRRPPPSRSELAQEVMAYEELYWATVFRLVARIRNLRLPAQIDQVRLVQVIDCTDGVLVRRYPNPREAFSVVYQRSASSVNELIGNLPIFNPYRRQAPPPNDSAGLHFDGNGKIDIMQPIAVAISTYYTPDFFSISLWLPPLTGEPPSPQSQALSDVGTFLIAAHLNLPGPGGRPDPDAAISRLAAIEVDYYRALEAADGEPAMQQYFTANPFVLSHSGMLLEERFWVGDNRAFEIDFLFSEPVATSHTHLFVEIESPTKQLFHQTGTQPRAELTEACNQIDRWRTWLRRNYQRFRSEYFRDFTDAAYLLVIGRSEELDGSLEKTDALRDMNARSPDLQILTYDQLGDRLTELRNRLVALTRPPEIL